MTSSMSKFSNSVHNRCGYVCLIGTDILRLVCVLFLCLSFSFNLSARLQRSIVDSIWQSLNSSGHTHLMDTFYQRISKQQELLSLDDVIYAINLGVNHPEVKTDPKKLMLWHRLSGEMYQPHQKMSLNTLFHFKLALGYAQQLKELQQEIDISLKIAKVYTSLQLIKKAYPYIRRSITLCQDKKNSKYLPYVSKDFKEIGDLLVLLGKLEEANIWYAKASRRKLFPDVLTEIYNYNNWGLNAKNQQEYPKALEIFDRGIAIAQKHGIEIWVGIMKGNQGWVYYQMGQHERAIDLFKYDLETSTTYGDSENTARVALLLAQVYLKKQQAKEVKHYIQIAENHSKPIDYTYDKLEIWAKYYELIGEWLKAYQFKTKAKETSDSITKIRNEVDAERMKQLLHFIAVEDSIQLQKQELLREKKVFRSRVLILLGIMAIGGAIVVVFYTRQKSLIKKLKKEQAQSQAREKEYMEQIQKQASSLEQLKKIQARLEKFREDQAEAPLLAALANSNIFLEKDWRAFKHLFDEVHDGFIEKLSAHEAQFTQAEIRLLALSKLELNNYEIAEALGISIHGVKKGKQRLRKKLGECPKENGLILLLS